jgi:hypothetical protein
MVAGAWRLKARSWGASTPMKMCIQADLDATGALRHMNKNNSERPVCSTHLLAPISTSFLFVFDTEWVMSTWVTCEHQGRDTVLQTGVNCKDTENPRKWDGAICGLRRASPGSGWAGCGAGLEGAPA